MKIELFEKTIEAEFIIETNSITEESTEEESRCKYYIILIDCNKHTIDELEDICMDMLKWFKISIIENGKKYPFGNFHIPISLSSVMIHHPSFDDINQKTYLYDYDSIEYKKYHQIIITAASVTDDIDSKEINTYMTHFYEQFKEKFPEYNERWDRLWDYLQE